MHNWATLGAPLLAVLLLSCQFGDAQSEEWTPVRPAFLSGDTAAARATMDSLSMREMVAQLMMVPLYSKPGEDESMAAVSKAVEEHHIGGVIAMQGDATTTRRNLAHLDSMARRLTGSGMLTAMDAEWGSGMRLVDGLVFPKAMALGATRDVESVREAGRAAGLELRRIGVGIDFAPVADVNSNPENPVIGNRSFGSDPEWVGALATAWAEGLRSAGVMAVGKHFPGHGDADLDSHLALPRILSDSAHLASIELPPFKRLIDSGVEGMMTAHLDVPALDSMTGLPTSLSELVIQRLLVDSLGFEGLVFTDALTMAGAADPVPPGTREVAALQAGNDILLFPSDPALVLDSVEAALLRGTLDTARIEAACLKVLLAKQWINRFASEEDGRNNEDVSPLQERLRGAMLVRLGRGDMLTPGASTALVIVGNPGQAMEARLRLSFTDLKVQRLGKGAITAAAIGRVKEALADRDQVVLAFVDESNRPARRFGLPEGADALIGALAASHPLHVTLCTSPYALQYTGQPANVEWMVAFHEDDLTQTAAMAAWCGEGDARGQLPVSAGGWMSGDGIPQGARRLHRAVPDDTFTLMGQRLDSLAKAAIDMESTPGMRMLIVAGDSIRYDGSHGFLGDEDRTPVERHHVYDLASITKVASTTLLAMMAVERGMITLDQPLSSLLPDNAATPLDLELGRRNLRDLLAHRAGLPAWIPFYMDLLAQADSTEGLLAEGEQPGWVHLCEGRCMHPDWCDTIRKTVRGITPGAPGTYRYSDLGYYLLQDILEAQWRKGLNDLADSLIYTPLGLRRIGYLPEEWTPLEDIAPTERDTLFRKAWIRGTVHDPGSAMMGGVAGHAGLFSDAHDLAVIMEAMRNGGAWRGVRLVRPETLATFTARAFPEEENRRGLGWDKPGLERDTGASGNAGSWSSFGHSGFTGTLAWTDPEQHWTVVILGNRICPSADNRSYIDEDIRTKVLQIVSEALGAPSRFGPDTEETGQD